jgi:excisionase family DNA binding protein
VKPEPTTDVVLTVPELAALLKMHPQSIYAMAAEGKIPGVRRIGRAVRFHRPTVLAWLASGERGSRHGRNR